MTAGGPAWYDWGMEPTLADPPEPTACARCGAFAPLSARGLCDACLERLPRTIAYTPFSIASVLAGVWEVVRLSGPAILAVVVLVDLPLALVGLWVEVPRQVYNLYGLVSLLGTGSAVYLALAVCAGKPSPRIGEAFSTAVHRWGQLIGVQFLSGILILLFSLLLIVPGVLRALSYSLVLPIAVSGEASWTEALQLSKRRMEGRRAQAFVLYLLSFTPSALTVVALTVFGFVVEAEPEGYGPWLTQGADFAFELLLPALMVLPALMQAVMHAKLRAAEQDPDALRQEQLVALGL